MPAMPHKDRENEAEERPSEKHNRLKSEKDPSRQHKSPRPPRPKIIDPETGEPVRSSRRRKKEKQPDSEPSVSAIDVVPEQSRTSSAPETMSRESLPYPSFSKAHSREAVNSREKINPATTPPDPFTPEPTDLGSGDKPGRKSTDGGISQKQEETKKDNRPPSPPDTEFSQQRKTTPTRSTQLREESNSQSRPASQTSQRSWFGRQSRVSDDRSRTSTKSKRSKASTAVKTSQPMMGKAATVEDEEPYVGDGAESVSAMDSNATSVAPKQTQPGAPPTTRTLNVGVRDSSPDSVQDSSPRTPIATPKLPDYKPTPSPFVSFDIPDSQDEAYDSPLPPPPPPAPAMPISVPRVDYLMQNGGLSRVVPKTLIGANFASPVVPMAIKASRQVSMETEKVFSPFVALLDQYETVLAKNGSIAVATGYRSVARRLLDRLENVFARDLSSEGCFCVMCQRKEGFDVESNRGLGWGEILEWVSNRRELPAWPAFDFGTLGIKPDDIAALETLDHRTDAGPIAIDPDVAEEFRDHFMQQSKKKKIAVSKWLSSCPPAATAPPLDIDDETLNFTILTHLESEKRPIFNALLAGSSKPLQSASRAPTPTAKPRADLIVKTGLALQRLYRLALPPRDPEACAYLLLNPETHDLLATLSSINASEWEILTSGRFDGFLWSGAESEFPGSMLNSPMVSRGPTPAAGLPSRGPTPAGRHPSFSRGTMSRNGMFSPPGGLPSRGPTPSSFMAPMSIPPTPQGRHPVSNDEETEIAVLAEVEREIYAGMEALEDAFESLHRKAEYVRRALRERGAGLSMAAQSRRTSLPDNGFFSRIGTPGVGPVWETISSEVDVESDWGGDEGRSEIGPEDSASNISTSKHRRPKRRIERRTPAPLEEEDEL